MDRQRTPHSLDDDAILPFGKHQGKRLDEVPLGYVRWLLGLPDLEPWLRQAVKAELARRGVRSVPASLVLELLEDELCRRLSNDPAIGKKTAGRLTDHLLDAVDAIRQLLGLNDRSELLVEPRRRVAGEGYFTLDGQDR